MKDYYKIIGVNYDADEDTIKNAYKLKIKKYHPDLYGGDKTFAENKTLELNEAFEVLKDKEKRAEYDKKINVNQYKTQKQNTKNQTDNLESPFERFFNTIKSRFAGLKSKAKQSKKNFSNTNTNTTEKSKTNSDAKAQEKSRSQVKGQKNANFKDKEKSNINGRTTKESGKTKPRIKTREEKILTVSIYIILLFLAVLLVVELV